jgi:hypothetical protein
LKVFHKRGIQANLTKPLGTSLARPESFNEGSVNRVYDFLYFELDGHYHPPDRKINIDETGISTMDTEMSSVTAVKKLKASDLPNIGRTGFVDNWWNTCVINDDPSMKMNYIHMMEVPPDVIAIFQPQKTDSG